MQYSVSLLKNEFKAERMKAAFLVYSSAPLALVIVTVILLYFILFHFIFVS
jgi:hypothetical protein